jgi:signal transduction histidine kinase
MRVRETVTRLGYYGIPLALAVGGTIEYALEDVRASLWLTLPLLYVALSPLLLRRRFPFAAPLAALGILVLESVLNGRAVTQPATPLFLGLFCFALFAAYNSELRAVTGAMVGLAAIALVEAKSPKATNVLAYFFVFVLALIGWSGGLAFRRHAHNEQVLRDRAERLELARVAEAERAVAAERTRIAREIHDIVAHNVSVMVVQARGGRRALQHHPDDARQAFSSIESAGGQALTEMRRMLGILRSDQGPSLAPRPSLDHLDALIEQVRSAGLAVDLDIEGAPIALPAGLDLAAYRVVQEALTNTLKHAGPAHARVLVRYGASDLELEICDDGQGATANGAGSGLVGMNERVSLYGGVLESGNRPDGGYFVHARLPLEAEVA